MSQNKKHEPAKVPPSFQIILVIISSIIIGFFLYARLQVFAPRDKKPTIFPLTPERLIEFGGYQGTVDVGLYIQKFEKADFIKNDFIFSGIIWFEFNPDVISLNTLEKFSFEGGEILSISPPDMKIKRDKLLVRYNIRVHFSSPLAYSDFPLEDHTIYLTLAHQFVSPSEIIFYASRPNFVINAQIAGWTQWGHRVENGYGKAILDTSDQERTVYYPISLFSVDYSRSAIRYVLTILSPLILMFFLIVFSFSVDSFSSLSLSAGGITGILAYRFVIESLSPETANFMISDYLFLLFLIGGFFVFFVDTIDIFAVHLSLLMKKIIVFLIYAIMTICSIYLFWPKG